MTTEHNHPRTQFVVCIKNDSYLASLELRKIYQLLPDNDAEKHNLIRIVDESGEDYLYPADFFVPIDLPETLEKVFARAA
ncbi:MAG: hypothetical protein ACE5HS_22725 [bacterium]